MERSSEAISLQLTSRRVALLLCGTFSPPTYMHLRMFERARDYLEKTHGCEVVEGIISPVADSLGRPDIVAAKHRLKMVELAVRSSSWIRADGWECSQGEWTRTVHVLRHFKESLQNKYRDGSSEIRLLLLCGGDVIESITKLAVSDVMLWNAKQIEEVVRDFGIVVITRASTDPIKAIYLADVLRAYQKNIFVIEDETCPNDISSTRLRTAIRRNESIQYCINDEVIRYIKDNCLYDVATSPQSTRIKLHNICKSASSSVISTSGTAVVPIECSLKHTKPDQFLQQNKEITKETHNKLFRAHFLKDEAQSSVLEAHPIWCPSGSLPNCPLSAGGSVSSSYLLPLPLPILTSDEQCSAEADSRSVPKTYRQAQVGLLEVPNYDNLTLDELLAASTGWADYLCAKKEQLHRCTEGTEKSTATEEKGVASEIEQEQLQKNMPPVMESKTLKFLNCEKFEKENRRNSHEVHYERPLLNSVSRSAEDLTEELPSREECKSRSLYHIRNEKVVDDGNSNHVTLTYKKYKLAFTPETTV